MAGNNILEQAAAATVELPSNPDGSQPEILDPANPPAGMTPGDVAAKAFYLNQPRFDRLVDGLSGKAAKRLLKRINLFPLEKDHKWSDMREKEAFLIACHMADSKFAMMMEVYFQQIDRIMAQAAAGEQMTYTDPLDNKGVLKEETKSE